MFNSLSETINITFWISSILIILGALLVIKDRQEDQNDSNHSLSQ